MSTQQREKKTNHATKLTMDSWQPFSVTATVEPGSFRKAKTHRKKVILFSDRTYRIMSDCLRQNIGIYPKRMSPGTLYQLTK